MEIVDIDFFVAWPHVSGAAWNRKALFPVNRNLVLSRLNGPPVRKAPPNFFIQFIWNIRINLDIWLNT